MSDLEKLYSGGLDEIEEAAKKLEEQIEYIIKTMDEIAQEESNNSIIIIENEKNNISNPAPEE
jgi:ABC-type enterochelin transport system substrate-binding protein